MESSQSIIKEGYKQTDVGIIPEDWDVKSCREICLKIQDGTHFSPKVGGYDYLYITSKNIGFGVLNLSDTERIDAGQHKNIYARCDVRQGDLLLTKDGANTGNATINHLSEAFSLLSSVAFLRFIPQLHEPQFYLQYILSTSGQARIKELMSGNAITRLTLEKINKFTVPVPSLPEQQAIAEVLSDMDALITSLDQLITKKRNIKQGTMQLLLTGKKRLAGFGGDWDTGTLGSLCKITTGKKDVNEGNPNGVHPFFTCSRECTFSDVYSFDTEAILIAGNGDVGTLHYYRGKFEAYQRTYVLDKFQLDTQYVFQYLEKYLIQSLATDKIGSSIPYIKLGNLKEFEIYKPKEAKEVEIIVRILSDMAAEIEALEKKREKYKAIKQGMMQELLTGKTRLV